MNKTQIEDSFEKLKQYCEAEEFMGCIYDGLNSTLLKKLPFHKKRIVKLAWIQLFKRNPINLRQLTGVKKGFNSKGLGLFLSGYCNLYAIEKKPEYLDTINFLADKLTELQSSGYSGSCWGYNFDWQAKAFFQPKYTPTVVATTFISSAFLDAFEITKNQAYLDIARSSCNFILTDLNKTYDTDGDFAFSYSPLDKSVIFNATLLGSRLLSRVYSFTKEELLIENAKKGVAFCIKHQKNDGSWSYGTLPFHQWIDNFHTGYNLECISDYMKFSGDFAYKDHLEKGFSYYIKTFFTSEGIPKYYSNSIYPIDIHAPAQLVITLSKLEKIRENKQLLDKVLEWTIENMQAKEGYFFYQKNKYYSSHIPYMRWAQAWMFFALSTYKKALHD